MAGAAAAAAATFKEGWLRKNHAGKPWTSGHNRRWFVTNGFQVHYYSDNKKQSTKGHFDLRNVVAIRPANAAQAGESAVELEVAEDGKGSGKVLIVSFQAVPEEREAWLRLWCSAIDAGYVAEPLRIYARNSLTASLNQAFASQNTVSRKRSVLSSKPPTTSALTPRMAGPAAIAEEGSEAIEPFDTPRGAPDAPSRPPPSRPPPAGGERKSGGEKRKSSVEAAAEEGETTFEITVPEGVLPGDRLQATTPSGVKVKLVVPEGAVPGTNLTFALPEQAAAASEVRVTAVVKIQARYRGQAARKDAANGGKSPIRIEATPAITNAATKVQSAFRGHATRNDQQEASRLEWVAYYMQPDVQRWDDALKLAVTPEEEAMIERGRQGVSEEEEKRLRWLQHYTTSGAYDKAEALVVTPLESASVLKAKAMYSRGWCACVGDKAITESKRAVQFVEAVRSYDWGVAEVLAISGEELQDVADSKLRVDTMLELERAGDVNGALAYAITEAERSKILSASKARK